MKRLLTLSIALTFLLFLWGATVRSMGAGLACPDWPLCHGQVIPPLDLPTFLEWGHRMLASIVGLCTLLLFAMTMLRRETRCLNGLLATLALLLLLFQAGLGGAAILSALAPYVVAIHLAVGTLFLSALLWMRLRLSREARGRAPNRRLGGGTSPLLVEGLGDGFALPKLSPRSEPGRALLVTSLTIVFAQLILGGFVASSHAGLACPDFPTCHGQWLPPLEGLVGLHVAHRIGALLVTLAVIALFLIVRRRTSSPHVQKLVTMSLGIALIQLLLGIGNIVYELPAVLRVAHLGGGIALYATLFITCFEATRVHRTA